MFAIQGSNIALNHSRKVYTIIELFGDVGGVLEIFVLLFIFFVQPLTDFAFSVNFIETFYKQRVAISREKRRHGNQGQPSKRPKEFSIEPISFDFVTKFKLCLLTKPCFCLKNAVKKRRMRSRRAGKLDRMSLSEAVKVYERGVELIEEDISLEKLLLGSSYFKM